MSYYSCNKIKKIFFKQKHAASIVFLLEMQSHTRTFLLKTKVLDIYQVKTQKLLVFMPLLIVKISTFLIVFNIALIPLFTTILHVSLKILSRKLILLQRMKNFREDCQTFSY